MGNTTMAPPTTEATVASTTVTTVTTPTTPTTPVSSETCSETNMIPMLRPVKKFKKVKTVEDCIKMCREDDTCDYYKWKTHKKVRGRQCHFLQIQYKSVRNWFSGPKYC